MSNAAIAIGTIIFVIIVAAIIVCAYRRAEACAGGVARSYAVVSDQQIRHATIEKFLLEIRHEKPFRFTSLQLAGFTRNYTTRLGAGGFGTVYKGVLPNGLAVAVKVFDRSLAQRSQEEQFMAEVGTIGRTYHVNLVRLFGFCFDDVVRALVYEYMDNGALDAYLLGGRGRGAGLPALRDIAVGVARGIRYLHEECQQKIVHYDIKPGNVLLDGALTRHAQGRRLRARAAGEPRGHARVRVQRARHPGLRRAGDVDAVGRHGEVRCVQLWHAPARDRQEAEELRRGGAREPAVVPTLAWTKYETSELVDLVACSSGEAGDAAAAAGDEQEHELRRDKEIVERMCKVAFWCVQQQPEARPPMGAVVKMLEGEMSIAAPVNPFQHLMATPVTANPWTTMMSSATAVSATGISEASNEIVSL